LWTQIAPHFKAIQKANQEDKFSKKKHPITLRLTLCPLQSFSRN